MGDYLWLIECAGFSYGDYQITITLFDNCKDFAKYFFEYLMGVIDNRIYLRPFKKRIESICHLIEDHDFPKNEFQEGVLSEWLNLYELTLIYWVDCVLISLGISQGSSRLCQGQIRRPSPPRSVGSDHGLLTAPQERFAGGRALSGSTPLVAVQRNWSAQRSSFSWYLLGESNP